MTPEDYLEVIKRVLVAQMGVRRATRHRIIGMAVVTLRGDEFPLESLRPALDKVRPRFNADPVEERNIDHALAKYQEKAAIVRSRGMVA